jgi:periplasmic protein TonB
MFEDSTFDSGGRNKSKSKYWMVVTFIVNASILLLLVLIPLIYPEALPKAAMQMALVAPPPPPPPPPPPAAAAAPAQAVRVVHAQSEMMNNQLMAPVRIPRAIKMVAGKEAPPSSGFGVAGMEGLGGSGSANGVIGGLFSGVGAPATSHPVQVKVAAPKKVNISAGVMVGMLIQKTQPVYPPIAKAARVEGTVVLQATISKAGTIQNLRVISGPAMLQPAAVNAVKTWRYKPYLLNNEPVEVETTVNVIFTLGG